MFKHPCGITVTPNVMVVIKGPHPNTNTDYVLTSKPQFLSLREERKLKIGTST